MLFYEIINDHPAEDPALICQDKMLTYGEVREEVTLWAAHLQSSGVCKGDKVGLFSKNCNEFVIAYLAIIKAGGVVVPFNFQLAAPEVAYIVQDACGIPHDLLSAEPVRWPGTGLYLAVHF